jgi:rhodanese-related sulfurtransferase
MLFTRKPKDVTPEDAAAGLAQGNLTLVDVRNADERTEGGVAGSLHIPLDQLLGRLGELPAGQPAAFVCRSGGRSSSAARAAAKHGVQALYVRGGMLAWQKAGLAIEPAGRLAGGRAGQRA